MTIYRLNLFYGTGHDSPANRMRKRPALTGERLDALTELFTGWLTAVKARDRADADADTYDDQLEDIFTLADECGVRPELIEVMARVKLANEEPSAKRRYAVRVSDLFDRRGTYRKEAQSA